MENNENWFEPSPKKTIIIGLPKSFQYSLIWTIFFAIIGIIIQSLEAGYFVFTQTIASFFSTNYSAWLASLGNFTQPSFYASTQDMLIALLDKWYYFFFSGGVIALLWVILSWLIRLEFHFKLPSKEEKIDQEKINQSRQKARINQLIAEGSKALAENDSKQAETLYIQARQEYKQELDPLKESYNLILNFYQDILKAGKNNSAS